MHPFMNERVRPDLKDWLLFIGGVQRYSVRSPASFSFSLELKKQRVTLTDLIRFQAQREARAWGFNARDLKGILVMVNQLNRSFLALTSTCRNKKGWKGLGLNYWSNCSGDFESNIADAGILEIDLNETFVLADWSWVAKAESEHTHLAREDTG